MRQLALAKLLEFFFELHCPKHRAPCYCREFCVRDLGLVVVCSSFDPNSVEVDLKDVLLSLD